VKVAIATLEGLELVERDDAPREIEHKGVRYSRFEIRNTAPEQRLLGIVYAKDAKAAQQAELLKLLRSVPEEERLRGYSRDG
jgi:hypothetical protein